MRYRLVFASKPQPVWLGRLDTWWVLRHLGRMPMPAYGLGHLERFHTLTAEQTRGLRYELAGYRLLAEDSYVKARGWGLYAL